MCTVAFVGVGITLMTYIPVYGMLEKLQRDSGHISQLKNTSVELRLEETDVYIF